MSDFTPTWPIFPVMDPITAAALCLAVHAAFFTVAFHVLTSSTDL